MKRDIGSPQAVAAAAEQLAGYVHERTMARGQRYVGVLTDGAIWRLYYEVPEHGLSHVATLTLDPAAPDAQRLLVWLEGVLATREQIPPTPEEVEARLGASASSFQLDLAGLRGLYDQVRNHPDVRLNRELWARLLASALGTNFDDSDDLFIEHTYLVVVAELVAHAVVGIDLAAPTHTGRGLLSGEVFRRARIGGVVEADFFDWPATTESGDRLIRTIARRLARFDWREVDHDVLKVLYESVIDAATRHRLGEYYTPDWLAERMVAEVYEAPLDVSVLDPACGSGTFLFWVVRRFFEAAEEAGLENAPAIDLLTRKVFGIDLHPVAVTLARVTYLLAIGTERLEKRSAFSVPVYLGDSMRWEQDESLLAAGGIVVYTTDEAELFARELRFPASVIEDAGRFDQLVSELADKAVDRPHGSSVPSIGAILNRYGVPDGDRDQVRTTFEQLCQLYDEDRDHIWGYYVRNLARPAWFSRQQIDLLIGNPPWLAYRFMPSDMQEAFRSASLARHLWAGAGLATHQDLSAYFVARSIEQYLRVGGRFAFVMPAAVLSRQQYSGFRAADFATAAAVSRVSFDTPWNLDDISPHPFPVPSGVVFGKKTPANAGSMPLETQAWQGDLTHHRRRWADAEPLIAIHDHVITVARDEPASPYESHFAQGATIVPRVLTVVERAPAGPLGLAEGTARIQSKRSALERPPWRDLPTMEGTVETQFLRNVYFGASILPFRSVEPEVAIVPWADGRLLDDDDPALDRYPGLADWWRRASAQWIEHRARSSPGTLGERLDYHRGLVQQLPAGSLRVVYTAAGENLASAVVRDPDAIVNSDLYWTAVSTEFEAYYLVGLLNSRRLLELVAPYQSRGQFGRRHFHKYVFAIPFPTFQETDASHVELAQVGQAAEAAVSEIEIPAGTGFQRARRLLRDHLADIGLADRLDEAVGALLEAPGN